MPQIHDTAIVEAGAVIGEGTKVWHFAHVREGAKIGADCVIGKGVFVDSGAVIGDGVKIQNGASIYNGVILEDEVFVGPNVTFTNDKHPRAFGVAFMPSPSRGRTAGRVGEWVVVPTTVCRGASLGAGAVVVCGVIINPYAMVGAGAVVTRDVAPFAIVSGNPATVRGAACRCGKPLPECGKCDS